jgi:hypothetical protein
MGISNILQDAGSSSIFWIGLSIVLIVAVAGFLITQRFAAANPSSAAEQGRVIHDWIPTGRIDFAGPSMDASDVDTPASFYLQAEDVRLLVSFSGIERKEIRWRKATLTEAKRVVNIFHRQMAKDADRTAEGTAPAAAPTEDAEKSLPANVAGPSPSDLENPQAKIAP